MSGFTTPRGGAASAQPKQISNRLLNMKFMQRAAATTAQKSPYQASTPSSEPQPKRRRTGEYATGLSNPSTPSAVSTSSYADRIGSGAFAAETNTTPNTRGTNNYSLDGVETEWVLNVKLLPANGHATSINGTARDSEEEGEYDDSEDEDDIWSSNTPSGRQAYGSFKRKKAKSATSTKATPASESKYEKKRGMDDFDVSNEDDISGISDAGSSLEDGEASEGEEVASATKHKGKKGALDFESETALKQMDLLDFQKPGFDHGFGRQRQGLAGHGRGFGSPAQGRNKSKKKARKSR